MRALRRLAFAASLATATIFIAFPVAAEEAPADAYVIYEMCAQPTPDSALLEQARATTMIIFQHRLSMLGGGAIGVEPRGERQILARVAGVADPALLIRRIGPTGLLSFQLVDETVSAEDKAAGRLPDGTTLAPSYPDTGFGEEAVESAALYLGEHLVRADPMIDSQTQMNVLSFRFDAEGLRLFCHMTRDNVGRRFAILLDQQILTAPRIMEPICGGAGQIAGNFTLESVTELAIILRAGALPAPLTLVAQGVGSAPN